MDVTDQLLAFEETNDVGVYIYRSEEKSYGHGRTLGMPRLCRTPSRLHKLECILLLRKNHYAYVRRFQRLMSCLGDRDVKTTRVTPSVKCCRCCGGRRNAQKLLEGRLQICDPWS